MIAVMTYIGLSPHEIFVTVRYWTTCDIICEPVAPRYMITISKSHFFLFPPRLIFRA